MARISSSSSPTSASSSSGSSLLYPSSCSSANSVPLTPDLSSPTSSPHTQDHLESLIARHGCPTRFSLSSLDELTATYSAYNPPSPLPRSRSPTADLSDSFDKLSTSYHTRSRPIPIPRSAFNPYDEDIPITPLTGRFERDYFPHRAFSARDLSPERDSGRRSRHSRYHSDYRSPRMRSDSSTLYSPVITQSMSSSGRSSSAAEQNKAKSAPAFQLGELPRFHPAVYQSSSSQAMIGQPPSPRQSRQQTYRPAAAARDPVSQYRDFVEGVVLQKPVSRPLSPGPTPRLNPLNSPGPVTPLALEEAGGYLSAGAASRSEISPRDFQHSAPAPDVLERLIARENERNRQKARKATKGW